VPGSLVLIGGEPGIGKSTLLLQVAHLLGRTHGSVLYVFTNDPAVKGADYTVSTILAEAFPNEVLSLYRLYAEAYASGQNFVNLTRVAAFAP